MDSWKHVSRRSLDGWQAIGEGTFGCIFRVRHTEWNLDVAVKKLNGQNHSGNVSQVLEELLSEAQKMAVASRSPHVISLYGILEPEENEKGNFCHGIVMEYMENGSLYSLLERDSSVPWALKFRILHQVALGMNWLHSLSPPLLHLDLKPKNVLLNTELHVKISDFGLSRFTHGSSLCGGDTEDVGGTLGYMPPEAFQEGYRPNESTDVYSFAILTSTVLTGEEPYSDARSFLIRQRVPQGDRPSLGSLEHGSSVWCLNEAIQFIKCCWHEDSSKRPSFKECCGQWEKFYLAHKTQIISAVRQVQDKMMATQVETPSNFHGLRTATVQGSNATSNMSEVAKMFQTLYYKQEPSMNLDATPPTNQPMNTPKAQDLPLRSSQSPKAHQVAPTPQVPGHEASGSFHKADYYPPYQYGPGYHYTPTQVPVHDIYAPIYKGDYYPPYQYGPGYHYTSTQSGKAPSSSPVINITGEVSGLQVGNHNFMRVTERRGEVRNPNTTQRGARMYQGSHPQGTTPSGARTYQAYNLQGTTQKGVQPTQTSHPQFTTQRGVQPTQTSHPQFTTQRGVQPTQTSHPQFTTQRGVQPTQTSHTQFTTWRGIQPTQTSYPQFTTQRGVQPTQTSYSQFTTQRGVQPTQTLLTVHHTERSPTNPDLLRTVHHTERSPTNPDLLLTVHHTERTPTNTELKPLPTGHHT
ncbi:hypothetical protein FKM82_023293 [Ascaphus truei]